MSACTNDTIEKLILKVGKTSGIGTKDSAAIAKHLNISEERVQRLIDRLRKRGAIK